jgi:hypothetical protein
MRRVLACLVVLCAIWSIPAASRAVPPIGTGRRVCYTLVLTTSSGSRSAGTCLATPLADEAYDQSCFDVPPAGVTACQTVVIPHP